MAGKQFGFKAERSEGEEPNELEELLGSRFVRGEEEQFPNYIGKWSEFRSAANENVQGVYRGKNENNLYVFSPFIEVFLSKINWRGRLKKPKYFVSNGVKTLNALHPIISTKNLDEKVIKVLIPDFNQEDYSK